MACPFELGKALDPAVSLFGHAVRTRRNGQRQGRISPCSRGERSVYRPCPISHVPVAACRLVGIRSTAGQPPGILGSMAEGVDPPGRHPGGDTGFQQQPAAGGETGEPRTPRGTQLKATTNGLFWSRRPSKGRHRRGLFLFARRAVGVSPSNPRQLPGALAPARSIPCLQSTVARATHRPLTPAVRKVR